MIQQMWDDHEARTSGCYEPAIDPQQGPNSFALACPMQPEPIMLPQREGYPRKVILPYSYNEVYDHSRPQISQPVLAIGPNPVLTPEQADKNCNHYSAKELLSSLNKLTGYSFLMDEPNLANGLQLLIERELDFGTAYAWFRTAFILTMISRIETQNLHNSTPLQWICTWIPCYAGLPQLEHCDHSLTTVLIADENVLDRNFTVIERQADTTEFVKNPHFSHPRRLWDLLANRVIPYEWHARKKRVHRNSVYHPFHRRGTSGYDSNGGFFYPHVPFIAISHSWARDLHYTIGLVNRGQWPVPLPCNISLDDVREQLLKFELKAPTAHSLFFQPAYHDSPRLTTYEYCWLDVVCLRQAWITPNRTLLPDQSPIDINGQARDYIELEKRRLQEWKIDVPTIGGVYKRCMRVLIYLNGLGREISRLESDWKAPNHWFQRAWTLQEWTLCTEGYPLLISGCNFDQDADRYLWPFYHTLEFHSGGPNLRPTDFDPVISYGGDFTRLVYMISRRSCSNSVDRIAGLFHCFLPDALPKFPVYHPHEDTENAWVAFLKALTPRWRWELSMWLPQPPDQLFPSWDALVSLATPPLPHLNVHQKPEYSAISVEQTLIGPVGFPCKIYLNTNRPLHLGTTLPAVINIEKQIIKHEDGRFQAILLFNSVELLSEISFVPTDAKEYLMVPCIETYSDARLNPGSYVNQKRKMYAPDWRGCYTPMYFIIGERRIVDDGGWDGISIRKVGCALFSDCHSGYGGWDDPKGFGIEGSGGESCGDGSSDEESSEEEGTEEAGSDDESSNEEAGTEEFEGSSDEESSEEEGTEEAGSDEGSSNEEAGTDEFEGSSDETSSDEAGSDAQGPDNEGSGQGSFNAGGLHEGPFHPSTHDHPDEDGNLAIPGHENPINTGKSKSYENSFTKIFDLAYSGIQWKGIFKDIGSLSVEEMKQKYGSSQVYTLIY